MLNSGIRMFCGLTLMRVIYSKLLQLLLIVTGASEVFTKNETACFDWYCFHPGYSCFCRSGPQVALDYTVAFVVCRNGLCERADQCCHGQTAGTVTYLDLYRF